MDRILKAQKDGSDSFTRNVGNCQYTVSNNSEERRLHLNRGKSLKSRLN